MVAAVTSTLRGSPTEVELGPQEGLEKTSCVNLCNLFTVPQARLRRFVGSVGPEKMREVCRALAVPWTASSRLRRQARNSRSTSPLPGRRRRAEFEFPARPAPRADLFSGPLPSSVR